MPDDDTEATETDTAAETADEETAETQSVEDDANEDDAETYPASEVRKLRREAQGLRDRLRENDAQVEALSNRLHSALVAATGRLQDPTDIPYAPEHLDDAQALSAAIDTLLEAKPHLKARRLQGDAGLGVKSKDESGPTDLLSLMRSQI